MKKLVLFGIVFVALGLFLLYLSGEKQIIIKKRNPIPISYSEGTRTNFLPSDKQNYPYKWKIFSKGDINTESYLKDHPAINDYPGDALIKGKGDDGNYSIIVFTDNLPLDKKYFPK